MIVPFFIYDAVTGAPLAGVLPSFNYYRRRNDDGTVTNLIASAPVITDKGAGLYEFTITDADLLAGSFINYVIDCTTAAASRYLQDNVRSDLAIAAEADTVPSTVETFSVTTTMVRQDYFPHFTGEWSATTRPTATSVTRWIQQAAADLSGRLKMKSLTAAGIASGVDTDNPTDAYLWCQRTVGLMVALRCVPVMTAGANPELVKEWKEELEARLKLLDEHGATALGNGATASGDSPEGPSSHISQLNLDTGDPADASDVVPRLRRSDML